MKLLPITIILFSLLLYQNKVVGQDSIKILTYNIEGMKPGTLPGFRLANIIDELKKINPDIIALQEINQDLNGNGSDNQGMAITKALSDHFGNKYNYYQQFTHLSWDNKFREYIGIISKYPVLNSGYSQLVTGVFPRKVVWNYIETPLGMINFFCTHLSFNSSSVRFQQVQQVDSYIENIQTNHDAINSILCGDLNDKPNAASINYLVKDTPNGLYYDSYRIANPSETGYTVPSNLPNARIEYIFYTHQNRLSINSSSTVLGGEFVAGKYRSDHLGVMSIFSGIIDGTDDDQKTNSNEVFFLNPNYPNPYSEGAVFNYEIFKSGHVNISILSVDGQKLKTIIDEKKLKGKFFFSIDTNKIKSQMVILKIEVNGVVVLYRIVVM